MRHHLLAAAVLVPVAAFGIAQAGFFSSAVPARAQGDAKPETPKARACDSRCDAQWMDANLRIDQIQVVGTAESYKQRPDAALMGLIRMGGRKDAEALDFGEPTLAAQLDDGVRALSFDVAYDPKGGAYKSPAGASMAMDLLPDDYIAAMDKPGFKTIHVLDIDFRSSCLALADCLKQVSDWSRAHPRHLPIVIALHTNDAKTPMPGATKPAACDQAAMEALETEVRAAFTPDQLITPDQLQGSHASLREAAMAHAWPRLGAARGKVILVLDDTPDKVKAYQGGRSSLQGRAMFVTAEESAPLAAFIAIPDPQRDGARIAQAVKAGFIVTTRADADTREARADDTARRDAAFASGAQVIETDFATADSKVGPYRVSLADDPEAMCGERLGAEHCLRIAGPGGAIRTAAAAAMP